MPCESMPRRLVLRRLMDRSLMPCRLVPRRLVPPRLMPRRNPPRAGLAPRLALLGAYTLRTDQVPPQAPRQTIRSARDSWDRESPV